MLALNPLKLTDMAFEILYTPKAEVRWAYLITAREQLDPSKPKAWTCELVLQNSDPKTKAFLEKLEEQFVAAHGTKKRRSDKGQPWKPDKDKPQELTVVKFKANEFVRDDGSKAAGPKVIDAKKQSWDGRSIGNGSKVIIAFTVYPWERAEGCGLQLQPKAVQVVDFVAYEEQDATGGFEEQDGYVVPGVAEEFDEFAEEAPF